MVGHTHEDIDGMFGCFSKKLKKQNATTIVELEKVLSAADTYKSPVTTTVLGNEPLIDFKGFFEPYLNNISHHTNPHIYRFRKEIDGSVSVKYKWWSTDASYQPAQTTLEILNQDVLTASSPQQVIPSYSHVNIERLRKDIHSIKPLLAGIVIL